jgi:putative hemolysin
MLYFELAIVLILVLINGLLAMAELAVISSRRARLQAMVERGVVGSRQALTLAEDPAKFLSTVQIGITLVGVLSGAFSGATLGLRLGEWLLGMGFAAVVAKPAGLGLVVTIITYVSLIIGELVPKQIALRQPEQIAVRVAPTMTMLARIGSPLVWFLSVSGRLLLRAMGQRPQDKAQVTDEEIHMLIAEAEQSGVIEPGERAMISRVMRLGDRPVRGVMTPRRLVDMIDLTDDPDILRKAIAESVHSRLPVHEGNPDKLLGVVQAKDLLDAYMSGEPPNIGAHVRTAPTVADTADALDLVDIIQNSAVHIALVHDEYGHFEGLVTNADILEAIVGGFRTDEGPVEPDAVQREDGSWLLSGSMAADEIAEYLKISIPKDRTYHTAAGFVLDRIGHLPDVGETFTDHGWQFEVMNLDGRRIDKILARRVVPPRRHVR